MHYCILHNDHQFIHCVTMPFKKCFLNSPETGVEEVMQSLCAASPQQLTRVKDSPVLIHSSFKLDGEAHPNRKAVSLLSGGGSGHEPSHAGYISPSMLSGAIFGGMFASPSVSDVLAGILAVSLPSSLGGKGCVLIVKNYTGDRLNFGMAAEKAKLDYGIDCRMLVVSDDCAVERNKGITGRRGVAGTVFVHKVCGGLAQAGKDIDSILHQGRHVVNNLMSIGVALNSVTIPGAESNDRLADPAIAEVGLGIHGEPGSTQVPFTTSEQFAEIMVDKCVKFGYGEGEGENGDISYLKKGDEVVMLVNNLGGCSVFELNIIAGDLYKKVAAFLGGRDKIKKVLVGSMMTSFNMIGASLSLLKLDSTEILDLIDLPTDAKGWVHAETRLGGGDGDNVKDISALSKEKSGSDSSYTTYTTSIGDYSAMIPKSVKSVADSISAAEPDLTAWDLKVGDGDCGITMKRGAKALLSGSIDSTNPVKTMTDIADIVSDSMGGTSGALFEIFFRVCGRTVMEKSEGGVASADSFKSGFVAGVDAIMSYGGAKEGYSTMLDALLPAARKISGGGSLSEAAAAAADGAEKVRTYCLYQVFQVFLLKLTHLTHLTHSSHSLISLTRLTHSSHSLVSLTHLTHSSHSLVSLSTDEINDGKGW